MSEDDDKLSQRDTTINQGMRWLLEHEVLNSKDVQEAIWWNVALQSRAIKDTEPLIDQYQKSILIYVELKWWGFLINKQELSEKIMDVIHQALPNYSLRVVYDRKTLEKAIELLKRIYGEEEIG